MTTEGSLDQVQILSVRRFLMQKSTDDNLQLRRTQIDIMAKIWVFLSTNKEYDYPVGDIRKALGYHISYSSLVIAMSSLQSMGYVKEIRRINGRQSYQLVTWRR